VLPRGVESALEALVAEAPGCRISDDGIAGGFGWSVADIGARPKWIRFRQRGSWMAVQDQEELSLPSQANLNRSLTDPNILRRLAGGVRRSCRAMLADLEPVDSNSLEVLLYCTEDLVVPDEAPPTVIVRVVDR
jgi:hypothetical protein